MRLFRVLFLSIASLTVTSLYSQDIPQAGETGDSEGTMFDPSTTTPLTFNPDEEDSVVAPKKKKRKKNVYFGLKTKKGFTKSGFSGKETIEIFNYLPDSRTPDPYVRDIYWYDFKTRKIKKTVGFDEKKGVLLHGPYKKMIGDQIIEEGIFFMGAKHGRWVELNNNDILQNKQKFYKGWPKESLASWYDKDRTKLKEIIPVEYGTKEGYYYYFHDNGDVAVRGEYKNGEKVGVWQEFYKQRKRRKKEIQYKPNPYDNAYQPFILREWDENGNIIYENGKT